MASNGGTCRPTEPGCSSHSALVIEHVLVRPQALLAAFINLAQALVAGNQLSDVPVRVVRLARTP